MSWTNFTRRELLQRLTAGENFSYELFWRGPFSQWKRAPMVIDGVSYATAEHYMMAEKARAFGDEDRLDNIPSSGCNSTHVARCRAKWGRIKNRSARRTGKVTPKFHGGGAPEQRPSEDPTLGA